MWKELVARYCYVRQPSSIQSFAVEFITYHDVHVIGGISTQRSHLAFLRVHIRKLNFIEEHRTQRLQTIQASDRELWIHLIEERKSGV